MSYNRVIPRDLFNESALLKCLGRLAILAETNPGLVVEWAKGWADTGWQIEQDESDGAIYADAVQVTLHGVPVPHRRPLNSLDTWALWVTVPTADEIISVFSGSALSAEFKSAMADMQRTQPATSPLNAAQRECADEVARYAYSCSGHFGDVVQDTVRRVAVLRVEHPFNSGMRGHELDMFATLYPQARCLFERFSSPAPHTFPREAGQGKDTAYIFAACLRSLLEERIYVAMWPDAAMMPAGADAMAAVQALGSFNVCLCAMSGAGKGLETTRESSETYLRLLNSRRNLAEKLVKACEKTGEGRRPFVEGMRRMLERARA